MTTALLRWENWLLLAGALLFVFAVFNALRAGRQARSAAYYGIRQSALSKTRRWSLAAALIFMATAALAIYVDHQPRVTTNTAVSTPTAVIVSVPSKLLPTETPLPPTPTFTQVRPTALPSATPTLLPRATPSLTPTATLAPNVPAILRTLPPNAATVAPNAELIFTTLASIADSKGNPVDPGLAFPNGTRSVRLYFQAAQVNNGAPWSVLCYKGNQLVDSVIDLWKWGPRLQSAKVFCSLDGSPGKYSAVMYLGTDPQFEIAFELLSATPTPQSK